MEPSNTEALADTLVAILNHIITVIATRPVTEEELKLCFVKLKVLTPQGLDRIDTQKQRDRVIQILFKSLGEQDEVIWDKTEKVFFAAPK